MHGDVSQHFVYSNEIKYFFRVFGVSWTYEMSPGANVIKLFAAVIYHHSMVILSFCVTKLYYFGMTVNYCGILTL
jgi:hypothetical protein